MATRKFKAWLVTITIIAWLAIRRRFKARLVTSRLEAMLLLEGWRQHILGEAGAWLGPHQSLAARVEVGERSTVQVVVIFVSSCGKWWWVAVLRRASLEKGCLFIYVLFIKIIW